MSRALAPRIAPAYISVLGEESRRLQAAALAKQDRSAVLMWLRHAGVADRCELATRIMVSSVFAQAGLMGLVTCTRCGDRGCDWCRS